MITETVGFLKKLLFVTSNFGVSCISSANLRENWILIVNLDSPLRTLVPEVRLQ